MSLPPSDLRELIESYESLECTLEELEDPAADLDDSLELVIDRVHPHGEYRLFISWDKRLSNLLLKAIKRTLITERSRLKRLLKPHKVDFEE